MTSISLGCVLYAMIVGEPPRGSVRKAGNRMRIAVHADGDMRSRPMMVQQLDKDGRLWFFTGQEGEKFQDILSHSEVNVSFSSPEHNKFVSITGDAELIVDHEKALELWTPPARAWFPKGAEDPNLALIRIDIKGAEFWDVHSGLMVQLVGFINCLLYTSDAADE